MAVVASPCAEGPTRAAPDLQEELCGGALRFLSLEVYRSSYKGLPLSLSLPSLPLPSARIYASQLTAVVMASPSGASPPGRARGKSLLQSKVKAMTAFKGAVLPSWEDTEIDTLPAHIVAPAAINMGLLDMEVATTMVRQI